ncbi:MAG: NDP-sugar synthase [Candidatus Korarchaeota archaeon]|nr:NDP-sugar synthase [Candidatus Korarchaeota archaeon]NIU85656.1 NTP transferase domain-containing protein [Candidatus Thorarchaeota archaeon]NIW15757.1 NTP transferase domain-containing protein [Candidatus Thorarchaeota archaeon]NIW53673.1 NTP transferase domain-containing protein [Candidatus Korarchaeota archaeon]
MISIVMAGGFATRLWPLTRSVPKPLLPLGEKKVIDYLVEELEAITKIDEIIVSTNRRFSREFENWINTQGYQKVKVEVEKTFSEAEKLGTIGALSQFVGMINDEVLVVAGDNYFPFDFKEFISYYDEKQSPVIATYVLEDREKAKQYGVVELSKEDLVTSFVEKPDDPPSSTVSVASYLFPRSHFKLIERYLKEGGNPDEPGRFIEWLHTQSEVYGFRFTERAFDIGTPRSYIEAFKALISGTSVSDDAKIEESVTIRSPVLIQGDVDLSGESIVGPYVHLLPGARVHSCSVSNSLVFQNAEVKESNLHWSIIGKGAKIKGLSFNESVIGSYTKARC